jgi:hypothetical protein
LARSAASVLVVAAQVMTTSAFLIISLTSAPLKSLEMNVTMEALACEARAFNPFKMETVFGLITFSVETAYNV